MKRLLLLTCGTNACSLIAKTFKEEFPLDIYIVGTDVNKKWEVSSAPFLDAFYQCPYSSENNYYDFILDICQKERIDIILPSFDKDQELFYSDNADLKDLGVTSLGVSASVLSFYKDKRTTNQYLKSLQIPVPNEYSIDEIHLNDSYFVKPIDGVGSKNAKQVLGKELLSYDCQSFMIQEVCYGPEVTLECFNLNGKLYSVARQRIETKSGVCTKAYVYQDACLESMARRFAESINLPFLFNLQFMKNQEGEYVVTDVNLRSAGGMGLSCAAGWNPVVAIAKLILDYPEDSILQTVAKPIESQYVVRSYVETVTKRIKNRIAFDLDGTLLDSRKRHAIVMNRALLEFGLDICTDDLVDYKLLGHNNLEWLSSKGVHDTMAQSINNYWIQHIEDESFLAYDVLYDGVYDYLMSMSANNELFLITARNNKDSAMKEIKSLLLHQFFSEVIIVDSSKNTAQLKMEALKSNNVEVLVGDTESDYFAAKDAGVAFYYTDRGFRSCDFWENYNLMKWDFQHEN